MVKLVMMMKDDDDDNDDNEYECPIGPGKGVRNSFFRACGLLSCSKTLLQCVGRIQ